MRRFGLWQLWTLRRGLKTVLSQRELKSPRMALGMSWAVGDIMCSVFHIFTGSWSRYVQRRRPDFRRRDFGICVACGNTAGQIGWKGDSTTGKAAEWMWASASRPVWHWLTSIIYDRHAQPIAWRQHVALCCLSRHLTWENVFLLVKQTRCTIFIVTPCMLSSYSIIIPTTAHI